MNNKLRQTSGVLLVLCILIAMIPFQYFEAYAATGKISFSDPSTTVGTAVSVTMKVEATDDSALGLVDVMLSYDPSILEFTGGDNSNGGAGSIKIVGFAASAAEKTMSFKLNFNTLQAGTSAISVTSQEIYSFNEELMNMSKVGASTVTVKAPVTSSSDANLSTLAISPGTLSPAFSANTTSYTASVGADVNTVVVGAEVNQSGAKLSISGNTNLKAGANKVTCKVTAEDKQTVKTYTITITKAAGQEPATTEPASTEPVTDNPPASSNTAVVIDNVSYNIATSFEGVSIPAGYGETTYTYKETEIACAIGMVSNFKLFYLIPESGSGRFFIYNDADGSFQKFQMIAIPAKVLTIMPLPDGIVIPAGYVESVVNIKGEEIIAYVEENELGREFCLFYAMNWNGEEAFYLYDFKDETAQKYVEKETQEAPVSQNNDLVNMQIQYNDLADYSKLILYIAYGLGVVCMILIIILIYLLLIRKKDDEKDLDEEPLKDKPKVKKPKYKEKPDDLDSDNEAIEETVVEEIVREDIVIEEDIEDIEDSEEISTDMDIDALSKYLNELDYLKEESKEEEEDDDDFEFLDIDDH